MTVLSVCNHKGGTGKTTTAIHVAAALGLSGRRVLVIDLDPQGFLSRTLDISESLNDTSIVAFFNPDADPQNIERKSLSGFDLIPSSGALTRWMRRLNKPTDVLWVREALREMDLDYDIVLFDTAAAVTVYSLNALVASQHVLIPVLPEYQSVVGAEQTFQTASLVREKLNPDLKTRSLLFTQVDARKRIHSTYQKYVRQKYGPHVLDTVIRTSTSLAEAHEDGRTVFDADPNARGARDYANATDELFRRLKASSNVRRAASSKENDASETDAPGTSRPRSILSSSR
jgi:chromosome partitioning protein